MHPYLNALRQVLEQGTQKTDRTGTGTISLFGMQQRYNLAESFPAVTTKKLAWRACVGELLWFIEGSGDERRLAEITHGTAEGKTTIWTPNAEADYWKPKAEFEGDLGRVYGVQWRHWNRYTTRQSYGDSFLGGERLAVDRTEVDQLAQLIDGIKRDPHGRRHIINAWNVAELDQMALPPCHVFSQFYVADGRLSCQMYQRSADFPLGIPFNIASYSLLTHMIAQVCELDVGEFVHTIGDAHIYLNQIDGVKEQLTRDPLPAPTLWLNPEIKNIDDFTMEDIKLNNYQSHPPIHFPFAT